MRNWKFIDYAPAWINNDFLPPVDERDFWSNKFEKQMPPSPGRECMGNPGVECIKALNQRYGKF